jgi:glutathione S-transferase
LARPHSRQLARADTPVQWFSVADAYLFTVLNWNIATPVELGGWPAVNAYYEALKQRPSIARALEEERALYAAEQARHRPA